MKILSVAGVCLLSFALIGWQGDSKIELTKLKCNSAINPIGIDLSHPDFSWIPESQERGQKQTAFELIVADNMDDIKKAKGNLWDSGRVNSDRTSYITYQGKPLQSGQNYFWRVKIWDKDGKPTAYSQIARFGTAILDTALWQAKWIGEGRGKDPVNDNKFYDLPVKVDNQGDSVRYQENSLLLRKEYLFSKPVVKAVANISGLGLYEFTINGERIGNKVLNPAKSNYNKIVLYDTYDVTKFLKPGRCAFGIVLGNGWFNPIPKWWSWRMQWFGEKRAIMQMYLTYNDGTTQVITTDNTWKLAEGPVGHHCIYDGELYDATKEIENWDKPGFDDSKWKPAKNVASPHGTLVAQLMPAIRRLETIPPVAVTFTEKNIALVDFGKNFSGWIRIRIKGGEAHDSIILKYAEDAKDGKLDPASNHLALVKDTYILKGRKEETYEPRFTYHGFQYVEVRGLRNNLSPDDIEGIFIHSAVAPAGKFECSNTLINKIHNAVLQSQQANLMGYPTDSPQREERLGWIGDAHVTAEEAIYNFDMDLFYTKWLNDIKLNQDANGDIPFIAPRPVSEGPAFSWSSGYHLICWYHYLYYGDVKILKDNFESMKRYVDFLTSQATGFILPKDKYGDWASPYKGFKAGMPMSTSTGYYYWVATIVTKAAKILGYTEDQENYNLLAGNIKNAFNQKFYNAGEKYYDDGTQFSNSFALFLGIVPESEKEAVLKNLIKDIRINNNVHLTTGILGTKYLMELLSREGRSDIAWELATQTTYPGWINMIGNRSTLSEHWKEGGMNSHNHIMFGSIDSWFYKVLGGIRTEEDNPGFRNITIQPYLASGLSWVKASVETVNGTVMSEWSKNNQNYNLKVRIPTGSEATVYVPANSRDNVMEGALASGVAPGVNFLRMENKYAVFHIASGVYNFASQVDE